MTKCMFRQTYIPSADRADTTSGAAHSEISDLPPADGNLTVETLGAPDLIGRRGAT
jgi:hypothetical protein